MRPNHEAKLSRRAKRVCALCGGEGTCGEHRMKLQFLLDCNGTINNDME